MSYHILCYIDWNMLYSIMNCNCVPYHIWCYCRGTGPSFYNTFLFSFIHLTYFFSQTLVYVGAFSNRSTHLLCLLSLNNAHYLRLRSLTICSSEYLVFLRVLYPSVGLLLGVCGDGIPIADLPSRAPCAWSTGCFAVPRT